MRRILRTAFAVAVMALPAPALAHGDIKSASPGKGDKLAAPPRQVEITFTEAPTADAIIQVTDGCGDRVSGDPQIAEGTATIPIGGDAQPGTFRVRYRVISAVDGHPSRGSYEFRVAGQKDCTKEPQGNGGNGGNGNGDGTAQPPPTDDDSSSPVVPIALGGALLVGLAFLVRRMSSR